MRFCALALEFRRIRIQIAPGGGGMRTGRASASPCPARMEPHPSRPPCPACRNAFVRPLSRSDEPLTGRLEIRRNLGGDGVPVDNLVRVQVEVADRLEHVGSWGNAFQLAGGDR